MFDPFTHEDPALDEAIASAFNDLTSHNAADEGFQQTVDQLSKLYSLKNAQAQLNLQAQQSHAAHQLACDQNAWAEELDQRPFYMRVSPDTLLTVAGSLLTAVIVVKYERTGVISSKVMSFMKKF